ncbi:MAG: hypothetical protein M3Y41_07165 [Pseudomonadota bacterium]|nr:hypothetical protein [Pseudomonadota bacterium]
MAKAEDSSEQIAQLRQQVEMLMRDRVTPALADVASRADSAMDTMRTQAESVSGQVRQRPLGAVLVAVGVGFALGRVLR